MTLSGLAVGTATAALCEDEELFPPIQTVPAQPRFPHTHVPLSSWLRSREDPPQTSGMLSPLWDLILQTPGSQPSTITALFYQRSSVCPGNSLGAVCVACPCILGGTVPWQFAGRSRALPRPFPTSQDSCPSPVSYTHLTLPTNVSMCRSRWSPYH